MISIWISTIPRKENLYASPLSPVQFVGRTVSSLWTFCFSQLPDLFPLLFSGGSPLPALLTRLLAALLLCLGLPLFTGLLACAPWVLPGLVLGVSLPLLLAFFLCTPPGGLG